MRKQLIDKLVNCGGMKTGEISICITGTGTSRSRNDLIKHLMEIDGVDFNRSQQIISNFENYIAFIKPRYIEPIPNDLICNRDYGWYNKFNKVNKRKNFKK